MELTLWTVLLLVLGGMAGGFINGFSGTGTALFALPFLLAVLPPLQAVAITATLAVLVGLQGIWVVRDSLREVSGRITRFTVAGLIGVPIGVAGLNYVNAEGLRLLVAAVLIGYGGFFSFRSGLPNVAGERRKTDIGVGFAGGVLGGLASLSGALPGVWLSMRPWPKGETRAVLQSYNMFLLIATVVLLAFRGAIDGLFWLALCIVLPAGALAAQAGILAFKRVDDATFRRLLIMLFLVMGLGVLARVLIG